MDVRTADFQDKNNNGTDDRDEKKTRMAGEALRDANYEARLRLSNDPKKAAERAALVGDNYDVSGYSDKEISMALQGSEFTDNDYARLTGKSAKPPVKSPSKPPSESKPTPKPSPDPEYSIPELPSPPVMITPGRPGKGSGSLFQSVVQDNDINTSISGDNNTVTNNQDNSVRQYGGRNSYLGDWMSKYKLFG